MRNNITTCYDQKSESSEIFIDKDLSLLETKSRVLYLYQGQIWKLVGYITRWTWTSDTRYWWDFEWKAKMKKKRIQTKVDVHAEESMVLISSVASSYENVWDYFSFHFVLFNISIEILRKL